MVHILALGRIILLQCQIFGVTPVGTQKNKVKLSYIQSFVNIILALSMLISTFIVCDDIFLEQSRLFFQVINMLLLWSGSYFVIVVWICGIIHSKKIIVIFHYLSEFDYNVLCLKKLKNVKEPKIGWQHVLLQNSVALTQGLTFMVIAIIYFEKLINVELLRCIYLVIKTTSLLLINFIIEMIFFRFSILNDKLREILHDKKIQTKLCTFNLSKICELHHLLSKTIKVFNETFGITMLIFFATSFLIIVIVAFYLGGIIQSAKIEWMNVFFLIIFGGPFAADIVQLCHVCYKTITEV